MGKVVFAIDFTNGTRDSIQKILPQLGTDFIIQEKIISHSSISELYSMSVNTFRIKPIVGKISLSVCRFLCGLIKVVRS